MLHKLIFALAMLFATTFVQAEIDVNKADQAALDGIRGIGPAMSKRILEERKSGGDFKDWYDLQKRVKGIKEKSAARLSANGLTVNGQALHVNGAAHDARGQADKPAKGGKAVAAGPTATASGAPQPAGKSSAGK